MLFGLFVVVFVKRVIVPDRLRFTFTGVRATTRRFELTGVIPERTVAIFADLVVLLFVRATTLRAGATFAVFAVWAVALRALVVRLTTRRFPIGAIDVEFAMADVFLFDCVFLF